jgi:pyruvate/2-oxoglutarate dehydrogenase complex dihydrolipoamide dehydrogenase (E3) component
MGGDCLNYGCVPSKTLIKTARFVHEMREAKKYGIKRADFSFDFAEVMDRVHRAIKKIEPNDSVERYTGLGVECIQGTAQFVDAQTVRVGERILKTQSIVLAVGASPFVPPIKGLKEAGYRTSETLWDMRELPKRLVVLGGGPIGCEMTQAFQRLGSAVTQVEMLPRLLSREDEDVAALITARFKAEGVNVMTGAKVTEVMRESGAKVLLCETAQGQVRVPCDEILVAVGRKANTDGVDWEMLGASLNPNGTIKVDEYMRANGRNVYACGDAAGPYQFTHTASHQAWYCVVNALFAPFKKFKVDYRVIPWVTFTDPEIAQVGLNEDAAAKAGVAYEKTIYELEHLDRAIAESENHGFVKVLTVPGKDKILGVTIVGHYAGEYLAEYVTAMKHGLGLNKILGTIHSYPTYAEANKYAAGNWKKAHAPQGVLAALAKFHALRR